MKEIPNNQVFKMTFLSLAPSMLVDVHMNEVAMVTEMEAMNGFNNMKLNLPKLM